MIFVSYLRTATLINIHWIQLVASAVLYCYTSWDMLGGAFLVKGTDVVSVWPA